MTSLGKSLVFVLKYPAEMYRLYWTPKNSGDDPDLTGLEEPERVLKMATEVGDAATEEAADFLELCTGKIEAYLSSLQLLKIGKRTTRGKVKRTWYIDVAVERTPWIDGCQFYFGIWINEELGVVVPYFWVYGGRAREEAVLNILGNRAHPRTGAGLAVERGTVAIAAIPFVPPNLSGFEVDRDSLVEKVAQAFTAIRIDDFEAMFQTMSEEISEAAASDNYSPAS